MTCKLKLHSWGFYWNKLRALHALEDLDPLFKIFCTFVCENVSSCRLKFPGKIADKYMENLKQAPADI